MKRVVILTTILLSIGNAAARASDPVGIYGVIERVVFEPNSKKPERIQIWGWFEMANHETQFEYFEPKRGCLYYSLADGKQDVCRIEWKDLEASAGTGRCIAFGQRHTELGKVRKVGDELNAPVAYPVASGLFGLRDDTDYEPVEALVEIPLVVSPSDGCLVPPGSVEMKIRNVRGQNHAQAKYVFEISERGGDASETSKPLSPGEKRTAWSPKLKLVSGKEYVWRVQAVDGEWKSKAVESRIDVKGKKSASKDSDPGAAFRPGLVSNEIQVELVPGGLALAGAAVATKKDEKPPHIVEKTDMKGRMESGLPSQAVEDGAVVAKSFFAKMPTYPDIRFREFFDPRYLKKHGLTDRDIAFEIADHQGIATLDVADDNLTVLVVLEVKGGGKEAFVMRCVVYEGHIYISPEKAPDPKTGIFKPWILRTKVN
jgi:hypothetical protein